MAKLPRSIPDRHIYLSYRMGLLEDAGLENFSSILGCKLQQAPKILYRALNKATKTNEKMYGMRKNAINIMSKFTDEKHEEFEEMFDRLSTLETDLDSFILPQSDDTKDMQTDALGQLSFQEQSFKGLNYVPFILYAIMLFKVWAVPTMAILTPVIAWILPYIFLKFMVNLPISTDQYNEIMGLVWSGNIVPSLNKTGAKPSKYNMRSIIQMLFMGISFIQSLVQPIQNALHLNKIDKTLYKNGEQIIEVATLYNRLREACMREKIFFLFTNSLTSIPLNDPRIAIMSVLEHPELFRVALKDLAKLEIVWRMSRSPYLRMAQVIEKGAYPLFSAHNFFDLSLGFNAVPSSVNFSAASPHAALTGPNGGGKSSFLRGILQCVVLSHTYGFAPADNLIIRRFSWISSGLRLQDVPGNLSMFETEVWFASNLLRYNNKNQVGLVLYDELFHSTNPPDGIRTAELFLRQLWKKAGIISIVSTHVFELVENAPPEVQRLCCSAAELPSGDIQYSYSVEEGICKISSVKDIWKRFELDQTPAPPRSK